MAYLWSKCFQPLAFQCMLSQLFPNTFQTTSNSTSNVPFGFQLPSKLLPKYSKVLSKAWKTKQRWACFEEICQGIPISSVQKRELTFFGSQKGGSKLLQIVSTMILANGCSYKQITSKTYCDGLLRDLTRRKTVWCNRSFKVSVGTKFNAIVPRLVPRLRAEKV